MNVNGTFDLGSNLNFEGGYSDGFDTTLSFGDEATGRVLIGISSDPNQGYGLNVFSRTMGRHHHGHLHVERPGHHHHRLGPCVLRRRARHEHGNRRAG